MCVCVCMCGGVHTCVYCTYQTGSWRRRTESGGGERVWVEHLPLLPRSGNPAQSENDPVMHRQNNHYSPLPYTQKNKHRTMV